VPLPPNTGVDFNGGGGMGGIIIRIGIPVVLFLLYLAGRGWVTRPRAE
jgi:hypothetical protein